jgi:hypothetical protein
MPTIIYPPQSDGASAFKDLTDVPNSYTGQAGKVPAVNVGENGLEFIAPPGSGTVTSVGLSSTDLSVSGSPITTTGSITANINNNAVVTDKINNGAVTADKLASDSVITAKILDKNVTLAKIQDIATARILGRVTAETGIPELLTASAVRTLLNVEDGADVTDLTNVLASLNTITEVAEGDILYRNGSGWVRLPRGTDNQVLTATATSINWENASSGFSDPMTTEGDIIFRTSGGVTTRLARGTDGQVLKSIAGSIAWEDESGGGGNPTTQNILVSDESSGSVDVNDADFTQLRGDENFSLAIFDLSNMVTGKMYYGCITNQRSASAVLTVTIPTGLFANTVIATFQVPALGNAPYQIFEDVLGEVHFVTTFTKEM